MATKQSKEVKIQREVEKWLTSYDRSVCDSIY